MQDHIADDGAQNEIPALDHEPSEFATIKSNMWRMNIVLSLFECQPDWQKAQLCHLKACNTEHVTLSLRISVFPSVI